MDPAQKAIQAALSCDWTTAIELNKELLSSDSEDIGAHLRLAHAYFESGDVVKAKKQAEKVLAIDSTNQLAKLCINKCSVGRKEATQSQKINLKAFLETPGKTHTVRLVQLGEPKLLASLLAGQDVDFILTGRRCAIETRNGDHVGRLPDDVALKLSREKDRKRWATIKAASPTEVSVMIHES